MMIVLLLLCTSYHLFSGLLARVQGDEEAPTSQRWEADAAAFQNDLRHNAGFKTAKKEVSLSINSLLHSNVPELTCYSASPPIRVQEEVEDVLESSYPEKSRNLWEMLL